MSKPSKFIVDGIELKFLNEKTLPKWARSYFRARFELIRELRARYENSALPASMRAEAGQSLKWLNSELERESWGKGRVDTPERRAVNASARDVFSNGDELTSVETTAEPVLGGFEPERLDDLREFSKRRALKRAQARRFWDKLFAAKGA